MSSILRASTAEMVTECLQQTAAIFRDLVNKQLSSLAFVTLAKRCSSYQLLWNQFIMNLGHPMGNNAQLVTSTFGAHCIEDVLIHLHKTDHPAYFDRLVEVVLPGDAPFTMEHNGVCAQNSLCPMVRGSTFGKQPKFKWLFTLLP